MANPLDNNGNIKVAVQTTVSSGAIDGYDVNQGATTDAAVVSDVNGTMSGKLRGLVKIFASAWVSAQNLLTVGFNSNNANFGDGQLATQHYPKDNGGSNLWLNGISWLFNGTTYDRPHAVSGALGMALVGGRFNFSNIAATGTTTIKSGTGTLRSITINTKGTAGNTITAYDNTAGSGTVIGTLDGTMVPTTLHYELGFVTGLTIVVATGTAANITVSYV